MIGIGSGVSTWDLVAWASQHTASMNQQMTGMMNDADTRQDEQEAISKIKEQLSAAGSDPTRVEQAKKDLDQLLQDHPELSGDLGGLKSSLDFESQQVESGAQTTDDFKTAYTNYSGADGQWTTAINGATDDIKKDDDKGMLGIQDLNSQIQQSQQLASGLISSDNATIMAMVNAMKA